MFNAAERLTADEALSHVYFADCQHLSDTDSTAVRSAVTSTACLHLLVTLNFHGDHLSGKPGNVMDFTKCQGSVMEKSCQGKVA